MLLPEFEVKSAVYDSSGIMVKFSNSVDMLSIAKSVALEEDESRIALTFGFMDDVVFIYPKNGIRSNYDYMLIISNEAEDVNACSLGKNFVYSFSTRPEKDRPSVVSMTPVNESRVLNDIDEIEIGFSESINRETFEKSFSITPSFDYSIMYKDSDTKVVVKAKSEIPSNKEYVIKINSTLEDLYRNTLPEDFTAVIYYKQDSSVPDFSVSLKSEDWQENLDSGSRTEGIPLDADIFINFDRCMKMSDATSYISITPSLSYTVEKDELEGLYLKLDLQDVTWGKTYSLRIEKGLSDLNGNCTEEESTYTLVFDSEKNRPVRFLEGYFQTAQWASSVHSEDDCKLIKDSTNYTHLVMDSTYFTTSEDKECALYLVFECSKDSSGIDLFSIMGGLSMSVTNSCCTAELRRIKIVPPEEYDDEFIDSLFTDDVDFDKAKISVVKVLVQFRNSVSQGIVTITLEGGIKDSLGNCMEKEKVFVLSK